MMKMQSRLPWRGKFSLRNVIFVMAALLCSSTSYAAAPLLSPKQATSGRTISGQVLDSDGKEVGDADVELRFDNGKGHVEARTDASGIFSFMGLNPGNFVVTAVKSGISSKSLNVVLSTQDSQGMKLILGRADKAEADKAQPAMEFADKPKFAVAGVTDWTAVGGHGSDATLRTSESLAEETRTLKGPTSSALPRSTEKVGLEGRLRATIVTNPESDEANRDLGQYYLGVGRYQQAIPPLQRAVKISPKNAENEFDLALALQGAGDTAQARQHVQRALSQKDSAAYHRLAGQLDESAGDSLAAVQQFERATELDAKEESYFEWGSELLLHRAVREAAQVFEKAVSAHPHSARMKIAWGAALFASALYDRAAQQLCDASDLEPADAEIYLMMGKIDLTSPAPQTCIAQKLARFESLQPDNADAVYLGAMALLKRDKVSNELQIETLLRKAIALDPHRADAYLQLGIISFANKKYEEAITFYQRAIAANPLLAEAHYRLGVAYDRMGDSHGAKQELELHGQLVKEQADATEEERRRIKQFVVVPHMPPVTSEIPRP